MSEMKKKVLESLLKQMQEMMSAEHADVPLKEDELSDVMDEAKEEAVECDEEEEEVKPKLKPKMKSVSLAAIKASRPQPKASLSAIVASLVPSKKK